MRNRATGSSGYQYREVLLVLILTRRVDETLIIKLPDGQEIRVTVIDLNGNQVQLGTEAPNSG
jgi:hypothetical protein